VSESCPGGEGVVEEGTLDLEGEEVELIVEGWVEEEVGWVEVGEEEVEVEF